MPSSFLNNSHDVRALWRRVVDTRERQELFIIHIYFYIIYKFNNSHNVRALWWRVVDTSERQEKGNVWWGALHEIVGHRGPNVSVKTVEDSGAWDVLGQLGLSDALQKGAG